MAVQPLNKFITDALITLLVYGRTGSGKTNLVTKAAQYDEFAPLEIIDFDLRLDGLVETLPKSALDRIQFQSYRDLTIPGEAYDRAWSRLRELENLAGKPDAPKSVFLDSITFLGKSFLDMVVYLDASKGDTGNKSRYGELLAARDHYGPQMQHVERFVQRLTGLKQKGYNIFVSAHEDKEKDEVTGRTYKGVDVTGKLANRLPGYFNEYWHTEVEPSKTVGGNVSFVVRTNVSDSTDGRTAFSKVLNPVESQDQIWSKIVTHLRGKK